MGDDTSLSPRRASEERRWGEGAGPRAVGAGTAGFGLGAQVEDEGGPGACWRYPVCHRGPAGCTRGARERCAGPAPGPDGG